MTFLRKLMAAGCFVVGVFACSALLAVETENPATTELDAAADVVANETVASQTVANQAVVNHKPAESAAAAPSQTASVAESLDTEAAVTAAGASAVKSAEPLKPARLSYEKAPSNTGSQLLTLVLSLGLIIALIYGLSLFVRRFGQGLGYGSGQIKVLATLPLGAREKISVIEVGNQQLLIGVTATQITQLHVFETPVIHAQAKPNPSDFAQKLKAVMSGQSITPASSNDATTPAARS